MSTIRYTEGSLDRASKLREDDDWVSAAFVSDAAEAVLVHDDRHLVVGAGDAEREPRVARVSLSRVRDGLATASFPWVMLGLDGETPVFAVELTTDALTRIGDLHTHGEFVDLRRVGMLVPPDDAAIMAYARAMLGWHRRHRFCSQCGSTTESRRAGHVRRCCNPDCALESFPRTDPVVIMLVTLPPSGPFPARCLLGRHTRLPKGVYSLLAGFVEPGESLEQAVAREVWEETGVRVRDVRYEASQPWPFPYSMMMGFRATATSEDIAIDTDELDDAQWFTAADLARFGDWEDPSANYRLPRRDSIAWSLVHRWLNEQAN